MHLYRRCSHHDPTCTKCRWSYKFEHEGQTIRKSTGVANKKAAQRIADAQRTSYMERAKGVVERVESVAVPLVDLAQRYLEWAKGDHPLTAEDEDARIVQGFLDVLARSDGEALFAHHVTRARIDWWRTKRLTHTTRKKTLVTRATVNRELNVIRALFRQGVEWKLIAENPTAGMKDFKTDEKEIQILTRDELRTCFDELPVPFNLFARVTFETLPRLAEVTNLTRHDVGVALLSDGTRAGWLQRRLKGGKRKRVRIPLDLAEALLAQVDGRPAQEALFPDHCEGRALRRVRVTPAKRQRRARSSTVSATFTRLFRALAALHPELPGLRRATHHVFRHTGITAMLDRGVTPRGIQMLAGWSDLTQLQRYGHVTDHELARAVEGNAAYWREQVAAPVADVVDLAAHRATMAGAQ